MSGLKTSKNFSSPTSFNRGYDILGNIAIVKFERKTKLSQKKKFALDLMKSHHGVTTVLEKTAKFHGRLRTLTTKYIAGEKTKESLYRENGCTFRLNVDTCYFSPRLASERNEISKMVKSGEKVLVLFGGVAPFAIVIAKNSKAAEVTSIELGRECSKYAFENVKRNKLRNVKIIQGDVRKLLPKIKEKFDRIIMARPNLKDSFLNVTIPKIKKNGVIHYYGFYEEIEVKAKVLHQLIEDESKKLRKKIKILNLKEAGDIGVRKYRYRIDFKVLN